MPISKKFLALLTLTCALAVASVAYAAGLTIKTTPSHPKRGTKVEMRVSGLKAGEKVKAVELITVSGQKRTLYPKQTASPTGVLINTVKAEVKGKHVWTYTGRTSHRKGSTYYVVR